MRYTSLIVALLALTVSACGDNEIETSKPPSANAIPPKSSTATESTSSMKKDAMNKSADTAGKDSMAKMEKGGEEMADEAGAMDKSKEKMAEGGASTKDKADKMASDSMTAGKEMQDKAGEMADDSAAAGKDMMDSAKDKGGKMMADGKQAADDMADESGAMEDEASDDAMAADEDEASGDAMAEDAASGALSMEEGTALAKKSGCFACHSIDKKVVGPAWKDVAARYADEKDTAKADLIEKVHKGGKGNWTEITGGVAMPPYSPRVSDENIEKLVDFVLSL